MDKHRSSVGSPAISADDGPKYEVMPVTIDRERTLLLICHMENDLVHPNGKLKIFATQAARVGTVEKVAKALKATRDAKRLIWYLQTFHRPGCPEYGPPPLPSQSQWIKDTKALLDGTWGCEFVEEIKPVGEEIIIRSPTVNGLAQGDMLQELISWNINTVVLCGISTCSVILGTTIGLKDIGIKVIILSDACSAENWEKHNIALKYILPQWATITIVDYYIEALKN